MILDQTFSEWERQTFAKGEAKGKAEAVLAVLESRGLTVTAAQRRQVLACTDVARLDAWIRAAGTAPSTSVLLSGAAPPRRARRPRLTSAAGR
jgi:hypothetical protein